jgi:putative membrane protein
MWYMHDFGSWGMIFGGIWMFIVWGGLIALIVWGILRFTRRDDSTRKETPIEIAKERYAKGEINKEEFEQLRRELR